MAIWWSATCDLLVSSAKCWTLFTVTLCTTFSLVYSGNWVEVLRYEARILHGPRNTTVRLGSDAVFICRVDGNPKPTVRWKYNGESIHVDTNDIKWVDNSMYPDGYSVLKFSKVGLDRNRVEVECIASNSEVSGHEVTSPATLTVLPPDRVPTGFPNVTRSPRLRSVEKGFNAMLWCQYSGDPKPTLRWFVNDRPINTKGDTHYRSGSNPETSITGNTVNDKSTKLHSLMIINATKEQEGSYYCVATNKHGSDSSDAAQIYVKTRHLPPFFAAKPSGIPYEIPPGGSVNILCAAGGAPPPKVLWIGPEHLDTKVEALVKEFGRPKKKWLNLTNIQSSKNYTCKAVSVSGDIDSTAVIVVKGFIINVTHSTKLDEKVFKKNETT